MVHQDIIILLKEVILHKEHMDHNQLILHKEAILNKAHMVQLILHKENKIHMDNLDTHHKETIRHQEIILLRVMLHKVIILLRVIHNILHMLVMAQVMVIINQDGDRNHQFHKELQQKNQKSQKNLLNHLFLLI